MTKYKALYKAMYDDLKDAEMMMDYACEIREHDEKDTQLADEFAKYAQTRLMHFDSFHQLFVKEVEEKEKTEPSAKHTVSACMWDETHKMMMEWYDKIKKKIEKY